MHCPSSGWYIFCNYSCNGVVLFADDVEVDNTDNILRSSSHFTSKFTSKSVPSFRRCVLEHDIGLELRDISDSFCLQFSGFVSCLYFVFCQIQC